MDIRLIILSHLPEGNLRGGTQEEQATEGLVDLGQAVSECVQANPHT